MVNGSVQERRRELYLCINTTHYEKKEQRNFMRFALFIKTSLRFTSNTVHYIQPTFCKSCATGSYPITFLQVLSHEQCRGLFTSTPHGSFSIFLNVLNFYPEIFLNYFLSNSATTSLNRSYKCVSAFSSTNGLVLGFPYLRQSSYCFLRNRHQGVWLGTTFIIATI